MTAFAQFTHEEWGHVPALSLDPLALVARFAEEVRDGIAAYRVLGFEREPSCTCPGYDRVCISLPVSRELFDALLNGPCGYRAQYAQGVATGEAYNRALAAAIVPLLRQHDHLRRDDTGEDLCRHSLEGPGTKFWFPKAITDPACDLSRWPEVIRHASWRKAWEGGAGPHKGLLAPVPDDDDDVALLLNGSFWCAAEMSYRDFKPDRSRELHATGWT
jgi:hypothetical protein